MTPRYIMDQKSKERMERVYMAAVEKLQSIGVHASLFKDYSGQGMYGDLTFGIVCGSSDYPLVISCVMNAAMKDMHITANEFVEFTANEILPNRADDMGFDRTYYFHPR